MNHASACESEWNQVMQVRFIVQNSCEHGAERLQKWQLCNL
jgi:hypothetical protein